MKALKWSHFSFYKWFSTFFQNAYLKQKKVNIFHFLNLSDIKKK